VINPNACRGSKKGHQWVTIREFNKGAYRYKVEKCVYGDSGQRTTKIGKSTK
jgi:hypothetical protein